jgi:thiol-disulfide isomerase/thioredoxin
MAVRRPGCGFCRKEAAQLCSIGKQLGEKGVRVVGVVHETLGVNEFRPFLGCADSIYFDPEVLLFYYFLKYIPKIIIETFLWASTTLAASLDGIFAIFHLFEPL